MLLPLIKVGKPTIFKFWLILHAIKKDTLKQLFEITEEGKDSVQPVLSIEIGEKHFCFSITDFASQELKKLVYYNAEEINDDFLSELFSAHPELTHSFYQTLVCFDYPQSCLIPSKSYRHEDGAFLMSTITGIATAAAVISETINEWQVNNLYTVPQKVHDRISKTFLTGKYWHRNTVSLKNNTATTEGGNILVNFRNEDFTVLASANGKLLLAQTFSYSTPADVIFYLLKICQQFGLNQQQVNIHLSGLVEQESALYRELHQYFLHVEFRNAGWKAPVTNESPAHFFTSLNDLAKCAS